MHWHPQVSLSDAAPALVPEHLSGKYTDGLGNYHSRHNPHCTHVTLKGCRLQVNHSVEIRPHPAVENTTVVSIDFGNLITNRVLLQQGSNVTICNLRM